jgi:hypothetical protein
LDKKRFFKLANFTSKSAIMIDLTDDEIRYYQQLDERQQRLYLGLKAKLLGTHGVKMVSDAYNVNIKTVMKGKSELIDLPTQPLKRIRKVGGGPKKNSKIIPNG